MIRYQRQYYLWLATSAVAVALAASTLAQSSPPAATHEAGGYTRTKPSEDGTGKVYLGREISQVMGHAGADWLDRPSREAEERTDKLIEILRRRVKPDDTIADIGAGSGYLSLKMAPLVPRGRVIAEDIDQVMLDIVERKKRTAKVDNVSTLLGTTSDPKLPAGGIDSVVLVDTYHEWDHPREMMVAVLRALKPGGTVFQIEYRGEDSTVQILPHHKMTVSQARREMEAAGLRWRETVDDLPQQHVVIYEKPKP